MQVVAAATGQSTGRPTSLQAHVAELRLLDELQRHHARARRLPAAARRPTPGRRRDRVQLPARERRPAGRPVPDPVPARRPGRQAHRGRRPARRRRTRRAADRILVPARGSTRAPTTRRSGPTRSPHDASLWRINLGLMVRDRRQRPGRLRPAAVPARPRQGSADAIALQQAAIDAYRRRYPGITQYAAAEISLVMPPQRVRRRRRAARRTPTPSAVKDDSLAAQRAMVRWLRGQGATVASTTRWTVPRARRDLAQRLIRTNGMGAQMIEVGNGMNPAGLARVFDAAARNGVLLTANGSTDDHDGVDWLGRSALADPRLVAEQATRRPVPQLSRPAGPGSTTRCAGTARSTSSVGGMHMGGVLFTEASGSSTSRSEPPSCPRGASVDSSIGKCDFAGRTRAARRSTGSARLRRRQFTAGVLARTRRPRRRLLRPGRGPASQRRRDRLLQPRLGAAAASTRRHPGARRFAAEQCRSCRRLGCMA